MIWSSKLIYLAWVLAVWLQWLVYFYLIQGWDGVVSRTLPSDMWSHLSSIGTPQSHGRPWPSPWRSFKRTKFPPGYDRDKDLKSYLIFSTWNCYILKWAHAGAPYLPTLCSHVSHCYYSIFAKYWWWQEAQKKKKKAWIRLISYSFQHSETWHKF